MLLDLLGSIEEVPQFQRLSTVTLHFPESANGLDTGRGIPSLSSPVFSRSSVVSPIIAIRTCLLLLDAVACPLPAGSLNARPLYVREGFSWALEHLQRLWRNVFERLGVAEYEQEEKELINPLTDIVAAFRKWFSYSLRLGLDFHEKAIQTWIQCGCDMLESKKLQTNLDMQHLLSQLLNEAILASHSTPRIGTLLEQTILQPLTVLQNDTPAFDGLHQSFQVTTPPRPINLECFLY